MRIFVAMTEKSPAQASFNESPKQLSAVEKSVASFGMGDLDSERGVILKDWSAQDFANIYVRFRPHLISHARKFLRDETQAEEVVQDAFLYLMTALPELDSELGVLRFLKWKTKMLCLDIIRASNSGLNNNLVSLPEDIPDETQPLDSLERADDAAIIHLALSKLNPRHREALIATMYEEKSHEEVAHQLGIGENAVRQLLYRARASFRTALIGEASVKGKSLSDILVVAARKAGSKSMTGIMVLVMAFISFQHLKPNSEILSEMASSAPAPAQAPVHDTPFPFPSQFEVGEGGLTQSFVTGSNDSLTLVRDGDAEASQDSYDSDANLGQDAFDMDSQSGPESILDPSFIEAPEPARSSNLNLELAQLVKPLMERLTFDEVLESTQLEKSGVLEVDLITNEGVRAKFAFSQDSHLPLQFAWLEMRTDEYRLAILPRQISLLSSELDANERCDQILLTDFVVGDLSGSLGSVASDESPLSGNAAVFSYCRVSNSEAYDLSLRFSNKS